MEKKKHVYILLFVIITTCHLLSACAPAEEYPFSPLAIEKRFGDSMEEVVGDLGIDLTTAEVQEISEEQTDITVRNVSVGENSMATAIILRFYNNIFYSIFCSSEDIGYIYDQTIAMYELCNDKYGEEMTDENITERNILRRIDSKPSKEEFVNCTKDTCAYVAAWRAKNDKVSKDAWNGEEIRFDITANSITYNGEKWATLGMSFEPLYFDPERMDTGSE